MSGKRKRKFVSIFSALAILLACFATGQTAKAMDITDIKETSGLAKSEDNLPELIEEAKKNMANASISGDNLPVFLVWITNGEANDFANAFYVRDTYRTGDTYLVTSGYVDAYVKEGLEVYLLNETFYAQITESYTDETGVFAYLVCDELKSMEPLEMTDEFINSDSSIASMTIDDSDYVIQYIDINVSKWQESEGLYFDGNIIDSPVNVGSPVIDMDSMNVWGMQQMAGEEGMRVVCDLNTFPFNEAAAITTGTAASTTEEPEQTEAEPPLEEQEAEPQEAEPVAEETTSSNSNTKWLIIVGVVLAAIYFMKKKKPAKQKEPAVTSASDYKEGTVSLQTEERTQPITVEKTVLEEKPQKARYQLRGMGGAFDGTVFEIKGNMVIGRNRECQIIYPPKTGGISGSHCIVTAKEDGVIVRDLQSTYGTFFGQTKMQPQLEYHLKAGDVFYLGEAKQSFRVEDMGESRTVFTPVVKAVAEPKAGAIYNADVEGRIIFGRSTACQVKFETQHTGISTKHCVLYKDADGLYLMDAGSTNGTFLNENFRLKPNVPYKVRKGDSFFLASEKYTFVITED